MAEMKTKTMRAKSGKSKKGKVRGFHIRPMMGPKGPGFHASVSREPDPDRMYEADEEKFHPNLKSVMAHAQEAFGPPDAGEADGGSETPAKQDTQEAA